MKIFIMKHNYCVYLTCMGGYGGLSLLQDFRKAKGVNNFKWIGSHNDLHMLARSDADTNYFVPSAMKNTTEYVTATIKIIEKEKVDLFIPKSDAEIVAIHPYIDKIGCRTFLPNYLEINATQDKYDFYTILKGSDVPAPETIHILKLGELDDYIKILPKVDDRYWLRIKTAGTAGAYGATWIKSAREAKDWIEKWVQNEGVKISDFIISEYLPGRLFECILLYKNGLLKLAKVYENIKFATGGDPADFGIGSTPGVAKTVSGSIAIKALDNAARAVESAAQFSQTKPNGVYHLSAKLNKDDIPSVTEVNIGRTPSTVAIFNRTGKYNFAEYFLYYALDEFIPDPDEVYDIDDGNKYIIRSLDYPMSFINQDCIDKIKIIKY